MADETQAIQTTPAAAHSPFGPSSLRRRELCPGSYMMESTLKDVASSEAAQRGTHIHEWVAAYILHIMKDVKEVALPAISDDERAIADQIIDFINRELDAHTWFRADLEPEISLTYSNFDGELYYGTADLMVVDPDGETAYIYDWKTGYKAVEEAENNLQGAAYALALMQRKPKVKTVKVCFFNPVIHQESRADFSDYNALASYITAIIEKCQGDGKDLRLPGEEQCRYCKAAALGCCPEHRRDITAVADMSENRLPYTRMPDQTLVWLREKCKAAAQIMDGVETEMKARIAAKGDCAGWTVKSSSGGREARDIAALFNAVKDTLSQEEFLTYCTPSVAKIEKAFAVAKKLRGECATEKEAKGLFSSLTAECISDKKSRECLEPPKP